MSTLTQGETLRAGGAARKPGTRQSYMTLSGPLTTASVAAYDMAYRTLARLPMKTKRWRIGFANRNLRSTTTLTTPCTITGLYIGTPVYGTASVTGARWQGAATAALTQVAGQIAVPVDGTVGWSTWVTGAGYQFDPYVEKVIGWGHSNPATGNGFGYSSTSYQAYRQTGQSANPGPAALSTPEFTTQMFLDIIIEYEFDGPGQIGVFVGDSNTFGVATSAPPLFPSSQTGTLPHEAWPTVAGELATFSAINLGVGSTTLSDFASGFPGLWTRIDLTTVPIDFAVVSLGTNGLSSSQGNFDNFVSYILQINAKLRSYGIRRIYWTDITPRGLTACATTLAAAVNAGDTTFQTNATLSFNDGQSNGVLGTDTNGEFFGATSTTPTGTGPYTYTLSAAAANAHAVGDIVTSGTEAARRRINAWLRNLPDGISGIISFELAFEASPQSASADPRLVCTDGLHFARGAAMQRAANAAIAGIQMKLT